MKEVVFGGRRFVLSVDKNEIAQAVSHVAAELNADYKDREPLFLVVLNGAFMFASDLLKKVNLRCTVSFVKLSSYSGMASTQNVRELIGLNEDLAGKDVIVVEDIVDTGLTMHGMIATLKEKGAASVEVCSFVHKPEALKYEDARPKYIGMNIPNRFIIGYGLDLDGLARNLPEIYELAKD